MVLILMITISGIVVGDDGGCPGSSCSYPVYLEPTSENQIIIDEADIWEEDTFLNGSLRVSSNLTVSGINMTIGGGGILIEDGATLTVSDSIIDSYDISFVYYMEVYGTLILMNTTVVNCLNPMNSYFGIYVKSGSMELRNVDMSRSGMIQSDNSTVSVSGSSISGLVSIHSDADISDTTVLSFGLSQIGNGMMTVTGAYITSNLTFSIGVSGLSVLNGGEIRARDVTITGTYNAGVFSSFSTMDLADTRIELDVGLYGVKLDNTTMKSLSNITVDGGLGGMSLYGCLGDVSVEKFTAYCTDFGLIVDGIEPATVLNSSFHGSIIGIEAKSPLTMVDTIMKDNQIGLRMNSGYHLAMTGCEIVNYGVWGIEEQTWEIGSYPDNLYEPAPGAKGEIAWWGPVSLTITGPGDIPVKGTMLDIESELASITLQDPGELNVIWGYMNGTEFRTGLSYEMEVSWKDTTVETVFTPERGQDIRISMPLTDIWISGIEYREGSALVNIVSNGTGADNVLVSLYADESWRGEATASLDPDEVTIVNIPLDLDEGEHQLMARASTVDEYKGSGGMLQDNNEHENSVIVEEKADRGTFMIWLAVTGIILLILVPFLIKDRTKS